MSTCEYTFAAPDGNEITIKGKNAFKAYLANGGLAHLMPSRMKGLTASAAETAIGRLMKDQAGEVTINRPDVGAVSLVYGDDKAGLRHIADRRGTSIMERLPQLLESGTVYTKPDQPSRLFIGNDRDEAVLRLDWNGDKKTWLVSAYEKYPNLREDRGAMQSRQDVASSAQGLNPESLAAALNKGAVGSAVRALTDAGVIVLHKNNKTLPGAAKSKRGVQAVTMPDGTIHMVANVLSSDNAQAVLFHEAFHNGGKALIGGAAWSDMMGRLGSLYNQSEKSTGKAREFFDKARARVASGKKQGAVATRMEVEEFAAYAIEEYASAPASIKKWVDDLIGMVKAWALERFGKQLGAVTPAQLTALAKMAVMDAANERQGMFGEPAYSATEQTNAPEFNKFFGDSKAVDAAITQSPQNSEWDRFTYKGVTVDFEQGDNGISVFDIMSTARRSGEARDAMRILKNRFGNVRAEGIVEEWKEAVGFWQQMLNEGVIDEGVQLDGKKLIKSAIANSDIRYSVTPEQGEQAIDEADKALTEAVAKPDYIGRVVTDVGLSARLIVHPRQIAAIHPEFTPVYRTAISQMETRDKHIAELGRDVAAYDSLPQQGKENVNKVLELGRLMSQTYTKEELASGLVNTGERTVVSMEDGKPKKAKVKVDALLSGAGEVITLTKEEIDAYTDLRKMFNTALDMMRNQTLTELGFQGFAQMDGRKPMSISDGKEGTVILKGDVYTDEEKAELRKAGPDKEAVAKILAKNPILTVIRKFEGAKWNSEEFGYEFTKDQRPALEKELDSFLKKSAAMQILDVIDDNTPADVAEEVKNIAKFVSEIEQAKRAGYVPFARYGDYVVTVKEKVANVKYIEDDSEHLIAQNVPDSFADSMLDLGAEQTPEGWRIETAQKKDVEKLTEKTIYSAKVETGINEFLAERGAKNVEEIPSVKAAIEKARKEHVGNNPNRRIVAFKIDNKKPDAAVKMADVDVLAEVAGMDNATWDVVREKLVSAIKSQGFRRHFFHSDNVPGYTGDFERSIADYVIGMSGYLSRRQHMSRWENSVSSIKGKPKLFEYASNYRDYVNNPQEELAMIRQIGFFSYIAGVAASAFANLTQVPFLTVPTLTQVAPLPLVLKETARAYKDAFMMLARPSRVGLDMFDPNKAPADVRPAIKDGWDEGVFVPLESFDLMMTARQRNVGRRKLVKGFNQTSQVVAIAFTFAERLNRLVTFIAAHRLAEKRAVQMNAEKVLAGDSLARAEILGRNWNARNFAEWAVDESQFRMGKANRPTTMRGVGSAIMQFKGFMLQTFEAWYRMAALHGKPGKFAAASSIMALAAIAGVWGMPGADDLRKLIEALYKQLTDTDLDLKTELRSWIARTSGSNALAQITSKGLTYPLGLDLTRVGLGSVVPDSPLAMLGIPFDLMIGRPKRAFEKSSSGDNLGAVAEMTPNFMKHWLVAGGWAMDGVRDKRGNLILTKDQLSNSDIAMKAAGFQPSIVTDIRDYEYAQRRAETAIDGLKRSYTAKIARTMAQMEGEKDAGKLKELDQKLTKIYQDIDEHNQKAKSDEQIIKISNRAIKTRLLRELDGVKSTWGRERKAARGSANDLRGTFGLSQDDD